MRAIVKRIKTALYARTAACCAIFNGLKRYGKPPPVVREATSCNAKGHLLQCKRPSPAMQKAISCNAKGHKRHYEVA